jgi:predicted NBD/HSP70 family sugar kinase
MARRLSLTSGTSQGIVLDLIRFHGPVSRVDLAAATGLTQATMSNVVRQLLSDGLVVESGHAASRGGRPTVLLEVNPDARFAVGVQIGAESITYVVVNLRGAVISRMHTAGVHGNDPAVMVARVVQQARRLLETVDEKSVVGLGVAAPGPIDIARGAILGPPHLSAWRDVPLRDLLVEALGLPVVLDNDATAAALGEFWSSGAIGTQAHATIYMGAGIGAGILIDGTVFRGASSNAGEIGQIVVAHDGAGAPVTLEQVADPEAIVARALESPGDAARLGLDGSNAYAAFTQISTAAVRGDAFAEGLVQKSAAHVAEAVLGLADLFDLDSISLAGPSFAIAGSFYVRAIEKRVAEDFFARAIHQVSVSLSTNVTDAAAVGAATLVLQAELAPRTMGLVQNA